ncbi:protein tyrosine kinase domain-containing protein [Rhizoctonia solani AG-1 IA]|uniref:Protein tyrosine kinase domain-containing protein n=1 Tax=Thanatephorus cucumeris (strain AG1-IA) TaxID=983506 RepID=L8WPS3_THACA|nr:protein tyrosine kinase domain-containing protein [Rhizoctonia solani AG-1 IA]
MAVVLHVCKRGSQHKRSKNIPQNSRDGDKLWSLLTICWSFEPEARPTAVEIGAINGYLRRAATSTTLWHSKLQPLNISSSSASFFLVQEIGHLFMPASYLGNIV